ncbi:hypothetical protein ACKVWE_011403 [Pyricularia oryzae]
MPLCRRLSAFGNLKVQFYIYTLVFAAGAAIAGAAPDINCVIIGRAITGIGGAGLYQGIMLYNFKFSSAYEAPRGQAVIGTGSLIFSGSHWPWDSYSAIVAWVLAGVLFFMYAVQQHLCIGTTLLYVLGGALLIIGGALQTSMTADSPVGLVMGNLALVGAGVGLIFQQGAAVLKTMARGDATKESDHNLGFKYVNDALVDAGVRLSDAEVRQALGGLNSAFLGQGDRRFARVVVEEISRAIGNTFFIVVGAGAVVFCLAFVMKWERLDFEPKPMANELSGP